MSLAGDQMAGFGPFWESVLANPLTKKQAYGHGRRLGSLILPPKKGSNKTRILRLAERTLSRAPQVPHGTRVTVKVVAGIGPSLDTFASLASTFKWGGL